MTKKFGKFETVRQIGSGGFGEVYEARDPAIGRRVAIKTCLAQNEETRERFIQEARLAGNLHHRNLTTIYDFGSQGDLLYIVCEFLPGEDLDVIIDRRKPLSTREKVELLIGMAYGLGHAHDFGVVHRDVKPANIRVLPDGTVKIMDFGIAKFLYSERALTRSGFTVGTSSYLAPEQVRGEPVDRRTDIFSFGVVAYELLSYEKPFSGPSQAEILDAIVKEDPPRLEDLAHEVPQALANLVGKAMHKKREERYPSMEPIQHDLLALREELARSSSPPAAQTSGLVDTPPAPLSSEKSTKGLPRWIFALAVIAVLAAACALLFWLMPR